MSDSFVLGVGFIVDLEELDVALNYINHDEHRWRLSATKADYGETNGV